MKDLGCGCLLVFLFFVLIVFEFWPGLERAFESCFVYLLFIGVSLYLLAVPVAILLIVLFIIWRIIKLISCK